MDALVRERIGKYCQQYAEFVHVVETGSFTAVAKEDNVTAAQVSRAVTALEQQLQTVVGMAAFRRMIWPLRVESTYSVTAKPDIRGYRCAKGRPYR
jgi:Bacterial regulatory helix-turn-helix protein, lysR family